MLETKSNFPNTTLDFQLHKYTRVLHLLDGLRNFDVAAVVPNPQHSILLRGETGERRKRSGKMRNTARAKGGSIDLAAG